MESRNSHQTKPDHDQDDQSNVSDVFDPFDRPQPNFEQFGVPPVEPSKALDLYDIPLPANTYALADMPTIKDEWD